MRSFLALALALLLPVALACAPDVPPPEPPGAARLSLLAVGDTGLPPEEDPDGVRLRVGSGMAAEDLRLPGDAVLLLGDHFYPKGLRTSEMVPRIRENLVRPFCHFLRLDGPRSDEVAGGCQIPPGARHPVPVHAVLGNHDYYSEESPRLQRQVVPEFVPAFALPPDITAEIRFEPDVSLVLIDSQKIFHRPEERARFLTDALRASKGPWRIVVAHHPPRLLDEDGEDADWTRNAEPAIRSAIAEAGVPVHVWLSGHEHSLQLIDGWSDGPKLLVVSGAGSDPRKVRHSQGVRFAASTPGFARLDLVGEGKRTELVVTLFAAQEGEARPIAQARVSR